ncbi:hypothetical protein AKJ57_01020 [candidate division MSBL1 archaeon SCGC-AAA259A05]|uniref:Uncharacterized protein n=1 Tax=candidate division MSBL1 archaeon SCGC-AAA259A05 TaxID=1698259 RepID=A0A133UBC3_9EURY|nr:hypothetical protein AKJ57_01020 [candidate division MSBL1 archaeon SCGC-AAA259A05]
MKRQTLNADFLNRKDARSESIPGRGGEEGVRSDDIGRGLQRSTMGRLENFFSSYDNMMRRLRPQPKKIWRNIYGCRL